MQVFFQEIVLVGPLGKTKYYALRIEFQERGSPHVHAFIWILDAPKISDETEYKSFVERTISALLPDPESEPELFELLKLYQIHSHSRTCWKYKKNKCRFSYGRFFSDRTIISKPLDPSLDPHERNEILDSRKSLLEKVKKYIDAELNSVKVNVIDPQKENYKHLRQQMKYF